MGLAAAALTAILVNLSFNAILSSYLSAQQQERQRVVVALLADSYEGEGAWQPGALDRLRAELLPDCGSIRLLDASGRPIWT